MLELTLEATHRMTAAQLASSGCPEDFPALSVPAARYYDPGFAALEMEHLWLKSWLMAGHVSELPEPGAYKLFERLGRSVIISRGKDDQVRAFHNTCRHRGSAILHQTSGKATRFSCPYHGWTYATDGQLIAVTDPQDFPCLDKGARGLAPVRCETWRGLIFLNFDPDAGPLEAFLGPMAGQAQAFPLERFVVKDRHTYSLDCNWKVGLDNTLEMYHVSLLHPQTIAPYLDGPSFTISLLPNGHARFVTRKDTATLFLPTEATSYDAGEIFERFHVGLPVFPNNFYALDPTGFVFHNYWPDGPGRTVVDFTLFGWEGGDDAYYKQMHQVMEPVLDEDWRLFGRLQRSLESGALPAMTMAYQERALYWLQEEIDRRIGPDRIPEPLRVAQVLSPYCEV